MVRCVESSGRLGKEGAPGNFRQPQGRPSNGPREQSNLTMLQGHSGTNTSHAQLTISCSSLSVVMFSHFLEEPPTAFFLLVVRRGLGGGAITMVLDEWWAIYDQPARKGPEGRPTEAAQEALKPYYPEAAAEYGPQVQLQWKLKNGMPHGSILSPIILNLLLMEQLVVFPFQLGTALLKYADALPRGTYLANTTVRFLSSSCWATRRELVARGSVIPPAPG
ncbi:hypothetical protein E2C01_015060 [Portunus trituberculatus]|uniref:Uncharacterized protein n=1 Tax=Portunus trituberculatus TaxID=210409 RepID=A0A5B7DLT4_PORTR|nr:hypothetical protein [Portunus trituberculatus]